MLNNCLIISDPNYARCCTCHLDTYRWNPLSFITLHKSPIPSIAWLCSVNFISKLLIQKQKLAKKKNKNMQITVPHVDEWEKTVLFSLFSLPSARDTVIAEREALFTWDDKSMNHLFQHYSAFAVPLGASFHLAPPPPCQKKKRRERWSLSGQKPSLSVLV